MCRRGLMSAPTPFSSQPFEGESIHARVVLESTVVHVVGGTGPTSLRAGARRFALAAPVRWYRPAGVVNGHIPELIGGLHPVPRVFATAAGLAKEHGHDVGDARLGISGETYEHSLLTRTSRRWHQKWSSSRRRHQRWKHDIGVVNEIRSRVPGVVVIFTGMQFELEEASFLERYPQVDFTVYGEYEFATVTVIDRLSRGSTRQKHPGLIYRANGSEGRRDLSPRKPRTTTAAGNGRLLVKEGRVRR